MLVVCPVLDHDSGLYSTTTAACTQQRQRPVHNRDSSLYTTETAACTRQRQQPVHDRDSSLYTTETAACTQQRQQPVRRVCVVSGRCKVGEAKNPRSGSRVSHLGAHFFVLISLLLAVERPRKMQGFHTYGNCLSMYLYFRYEYISQRGNAKKLLLGNDVRNRRSFVPCRW